MSQFHCFNFSHFIILLRYFIFYFFYFCFSSQPVPVTSFSTPYCFHLVDLGKLVAYLQSPLWTISYDFVLFSFAFMYALLFFKKVYLFLLQELYNTYLK